MVRLSPIPNHRSSRLNRSSIMFLARSRGPYVGSSTCTGAAEAATAVLEGTTAVGATLEVDGREFIRFDMPPDLNTQRDQTKVVGESSLLEQRRLNSVAVVLSVRKTFSILQRFSTAQQKKKGV